MHVTRVKLLRLSLIALIVLVLLAVAVNWVQTWRSRARIVQQTAQILSSEMIRSADSIEYSENENGVTRFRLRAEKLLETRQGKSLLQGIEAFDFNPDGSIRNQIRSRKAEYDRELRKAVFREDVRIEIGQGVVLRTEVLRYDMPNNLGETDDGLRFESEQAKGKAGSARYDSGRRILDLKGDLDFVMQRPVTRPDGTRINENVHITSDLGYYSEADLLMLFRGRSHMDSESASLAGDEIEARFTADRKRLTSLVCQGNAVYESKEPGDRRNLQGDRIDFKIADPPGALERIDIFRNARFSSDTDSGRQQLKGAEIHVGMNIDKGVPQKIEASSGVEFVLARTGESTVVSGNRLEANFLPGSNSLDAVHVWEGARMSTRRGTAQPDELKAEDLRIAFSELDGRSVPRELNAQRSVHWISSPVVDKSGKQTQAARSLSAATLVMRYAKSGETLESGDATGGVVLEGLQSGQAVRTEVRRLQADTVNFLFFAQDNKLREFTGSGNVRVFYRKPPPPSTDAPGDEFQTSSNNIKATFLEQDGTADSVTQWGAFVFQDGTRTANAGRSDYDARKDILVLRESPRISDSNSATTGQTMEYDQKNRILNVRRQVRSVLGGGTGGHAAPPAGSTGSSAPSIVTSDAMQYWTDEGRARYTGSVQMLSESGQLQADTLDIRNSGEEVEAHGNIRHLSVRRESPAGGAATSTGTAQRGNEKNPPRPVLIRASELHYLRKENTIHYSGGVTLESQDLNMVSEVMDALFDSDGKRIDRATARGKLVIHQSGREVTGEQGEYYLTPGKFIVTGSLAEIHDPVHGKSRARRLTFFSSDDRILLENK